MDLRIKGRTSLILGSTSGLGLAIAQGLAAEGGNTILCGRRDTVAKEAAAALPSAVGVGVDLANPASVEKLAEQAQEAFGRVDVLVLNAGGPPPSAAVDLTAQELAPNLETLLLAQIRLVSALLPAMRERGWGRVVAVGSSGVQQPLSNMVGSNVARAALAAYLKTLAGEVAAEGVTVNMVLPGRIDTARVGALDQARAQRSSTDTASVRRTSEGSIPAGRYGRTSEFADVVVFLCSDRASYVTGAQIRVDGGMIGAI